MGDDALVLSELWDTERLAGYLGVSKHYVYRLTSEHRIRFVRVGKGVSHRRWWRNGGEKPIPTTTYPNYTPAEQDFYGGARWNRTTDLSIIRVPA
ncbi:MAG: excisionase family DNA-binding protein [Acidimicrobiales bacterium]